ncbi:MAG: hypothetical protein HY864_00200 [Chloroflexi bacterium]|nr:hypothetical protein [Chloroflexota bacterium]
MLIKLSDTLKKYAKGWLVLILFLLDAVFMGYVMPSIGTTMNSSGPIDLLFFYTPQTAYEMVAAYGEQVREAYRITELTVDIIYPIVYTLFFSLLITWLFQRGFPAESKMQRLNVVSFGAWLFDLFENLGIVTMLSVYPSTPALVAWLTTIFTMVKWTFAGAGGILILIGLVMAAKNKFKIQM